ncbi:hypothetical protein NDU88_004787 [Pleurodeles waltl]|uniref:Uncharacterized protein n=1 Tax=Pleurodeles waltl TaxID=8319 RepID=A0AAV7WBD7_PLEWA|nr:hypothetical protein NDU88_004787 [Pleurodeles waltl]
MRTWAACADLVQAAGREMALLEVQWEACLTPLMPCSDISLQQRGAPRGLGLLGIHWAACPTGGPPWGIQVTTPLRMRFKALHPGLELGRYQ